MPRWDGCTKIHEGCGGVVKWVEAIHTPGVGYFGKCEHCTQDGIVVEHILPIETAQPEAGILLEDGRFDELAQLHWDEDQSWDKNQERLKQEIESRL